jgi:hypothetical protein
MGFITKEGLEELKRYKYVSGGYSFMDKIFNHWWEFFVKLIPLVSYLPNIPISSLQSIYYHLGIFHGTLRNICNFFPKK